MHNGMIKVVTGIRRCGKSYLLFNIFSDYLKAQGVDDEHIIKVDLEDRRNKNLRNPDALLEYIDARIAKDGMHYVMLDEVQWVDEFEDVLNSYLKIPNKINSRVLCWEILSKPVVSYSWLINHSCSLL